MKKSIIVICIMVVLGCFLIDDSKCLHQKEINQIDLKQCQKLMIVAHPDDETIWGGSHLLKGHYLVVCLTNGNNEKRKKESDAEQCSRKIRRQKEDFCHRRCCGGVSGSYLCRIWNLFPEPFLLWYDHRWNKSRW